MATATHDFGRTRTVDSKVLELDALLDETPEELEALYKTATVPRIDAIRGDLRGRMLAATIVPPRVRRVLRAFAGTKGFPWRGKSFRAHSEGARPAGARGASSPPGDKGEGINRILSDRIKLFRFETFIARSRAGDFDAVQLDYDLRGNPWVIRQVKDEIRQLRDGLFLGQAYFMAKGAPHLVLYFGLEMK
jgi:hypothetical protein